MILDTSAILAYILGEPGAERVRAEMNNGTLMSAVNLAETSAKLVDLGFTDEAIESLVAVKQMTVVELDRQIAMNAGLLRRETRALGLSLGDRCCLATAISVGTPVLTADRIWSRLDLGIRIELCR